MRECVANPPLNLLHNDFANRKIALNLLHKAKNPHREFGRVPGALQARKSCHTWQTLATRSASLSASRPTTRKLSGKYESFAGFLEHAHTPRMTRHARLEAPSTPRVSSRGAMTRNEAQARRIDADIFKKRKKRYTFSLHFRQICINFSTLKFKNPNWLSV